MKIRRLIRKHTIAGLLLHFVIFTGCAQNNNRSDGLEPPDRYNQLANAKSPYLQQHADNPLNWYEWGPEALEKAKEENNL